MRSFQPFLVLVVSLVTACGSAKPPPPSSPAKEAAKPPPEGEAKSEETAAASPAVPKIPTACASENGGVCTMPKDFITRLCSATFPNVALVLFARGTPWTHGFLTRKTQAWNAEGGASMNDFLEFDEEVLLLASRMPPKGGMQVSGSGGYQALRWNGSCVTLASEEVATRQPPSPKHPRIEWRYLDDGIREGLRKDSKVDEAASALKRECHGVSSGDVSKKCVDADGKLGDAIVRYVGENGALPEPAKLP